MELGAKYLVFVSSCSLKTRELRFALFGNFLRLFEESVFVFQFLNDKIHNYVLFDIIWYTFLKKYTSWAKLSSLVLREQEETKTKYFAPITIYYKDE